MNTLKQKKGITLIALVITIIVLLILAGITLTFVLGENGIIAKSKRAKEESIQAQAIEDIQLKLVEAQAEGFGNFTWENFLKILQDSSDTYLVKTTSSQTSSLSSENSGIANLDGLNNHTGSVYVTNLSNYKYEVEIGSDFKIQNQISTANTGTSNIGGENQNSGETQGGTTGGKMHVKLKVDSRTATSITVSVDNQSGLSVSNIDYYKDGQKVYTGNELTYTYTNLNSASTYTLSAKAQYADTSIELANQKPSNMKQSNLVDYWPLNGTLANSISTGHGSLIAESDVNYTGGGAFLEDNGLVSNNLTLRRSTKWNNNI